MNLDFAELVKVVRSLFREQKLCCVLPEAVMLESKDSNRLQVASRMSKALVES
jgi:hypothetical protein